MTPPHDSSSDSPRDHPNSDFDVTELLPGDATDALDAAMLAALRVPVPQPGADRAELEQLIDKFRQLPEQLPYPFSQAEVGQRLQYMGDYELLEPIGRGGMGVVYRARQLSLQREVAIKLLIGAHYASPELQERFRREAETVAGLDHPHIIPVYEIGVHLDQHYFSMKLVPGLNLAQSLREWTSAGDYTAAERRRRELAIAQLVEKVADAVHHAHQHGVLHRDIKPSNILLDAQGEPHVTDFGLAKDLESQANLTATGAVLGTPAYMSPEQAAGRRDISTAADVYGLGAILYELLSGQVPYKGESSAEILRLVLDTEPKQPRSLNPFMDRDLDTICLRCLRKEPRERYASAAELAAELRRFQRGEPILARPVSTRERVVKWARRQPAAAALAAVTVLGLLSLFVGLLVGNQLIRHEQVKTQLALGEKSAALVDRTSALDREERGSYIKTIALAYRDVRENDIRHAFQLLQSCPAERRDWEWHYLVRRCQGDYQELETGGKHMAALTLSPDGKYLAAAAEEAGSQVPRLTIRIWRADTKEVLHTLSSGNLVLQASQIWRCRLAFTPDSTQLLATGFQMGEPSTGLVKRWNVVSGTEMPLGHGAFPGQQVFDLPLHPKGNLHALTGPMEFGTSKEMEFTLVDPLTGEVQHRFRRPAQATAGNGRYQENGERFLLLHRHLALVDLKTGVAVWEQGFRGAGYLAVDPRNQFAAVVTELGELTLVDLATGKQRYTKRVHRNAAEGVAFHPHERVLATIGYDGVIRVANIEDGSEVRRLTGLRESPFYLAFDLKGEQIVTDGLPLARLAVWRWKGQQEVENLGTIGELAVSGNLLAAAEQQGEVSVWNTDTWTRVRKIPEKSRLPIVNTADIDPQARYLATGDGNFRQPDAPGEVKLWNFETGELLHTFPPAKRFIRQVRFSLNGESIAWAGGLQLVHYDLARRQQQWSIPLQTPWEVFAFRPGKPEIVISGGGEQRGRLYFVDARTGQQLRDVSSPFPAAVTPTYGAPSFSADGKWLFARAHDGTGEAGRVVRWDAEQGTVAQTYAGGFMAASWPVLSPNGRRLFTAFHDGSVAVWDTETGEEMLHLVDAEHQLYDLKLIDNGVLIAGGFEGTLHRWDGRPVADGEN